MRIIWNKKRGVAQNMIGLILKIVLYVLAVLLLLILFLIGVILFSPIIYNIYVEKYNDLFYEIKIRYLGGIKIDLKKENNIQHISVRCFFKQLYDSSEVVHAEQQEESSHIKTVEESQVNTVPTQKEKLRKAAGSTLRAASMKHASNAGKRTADKWKVEDVKGVREVKGVKDVEPIRPITADTHSKEKKRDYKALICNEFFYTMLKELIEAVKQCIHYILPYEWSFELIIGLEEPGKTGMLIAKLMALYPFYYQHGNIQGDYERERMDGGVLAKGKIRLIYIIRIIIKVLLKKNTRQYIRLVRRIL